MHEKTAMNLHLSFLLCHSVHERQHPMNKLLLLCCGCLFVMGLHESSDCIMRELSGCFPPCFCARAPVRSRPSPFPMGRTVQSDGVRTREPRASKSWASNTHPHHSPGWPMRSDGVRTRQPRASKSWTSYILRHRSTCRAGECDGVRTREPRTSKSRASNILRHHSAAGI